MLLAALEFSPHGLFSGRTRRHRRPFSIKLKLSLLDRLRAVFPPTLKVALQTASLELKH